MINTKFWSDGFISDLNPLDRYLFLYLITNEHTNICGIYELPLKTIAFETGITPDMLTVMFERLSGKIHYVDGWVFTRNFIRHQRMNPSICRGINNGISQVPKSIIAKIKEIDTDWLQTVDRLSQSMPKSESESELESELKSEYKHKELRTANVPKTAPSLDRIGLVNTLQSPSAPAVSDFNSDEYKKELVSNPRRHIHIIGLYWHVKGYSHPSKLAAESALKRDFKAGHSLVGYSDEQILRVMNWLETNDAKNKYDWKLETVLKKIDEFNK